MTWKGKAIVAAIVIGIGWTAWKTPGAIGPIGSKVGGAVNTIGEICAGFVHVITSLLPG